MGLFALGLSVLLVLCIAYFLIWLLGQLAPGHPSIVDTIIWVLAVLIIVVNVASALGLHDVAIPRLFGR